MIPLLIDLLIICIVFSLVWWILTLLPLPAPIGQIAQVVVVVLFALVLISLLLGLSGRPGLIHLSRGEVASWLDG